MKLVFPRLYVILDAALLRSSPRMVAVTLAEAGVELIQYRDKHSPSQILLSLSQQLVAEMRPRGVCLVVNDRADVAAVAGAAGVHVGQDDLPVEEARRVCGPWRWVGVSTHAEEQVGAAAGTSADYIAVGPVFETATKANPVPVVGLELIRRARAITEKPIVAIGGITVERAGDVYAAGADALAVASDILNHADIGKRAQAYIELAGRWN
ncbi:MAG: thiamine phosphate synthase [Candidatus Acidiferrales bacterium]